jgi:hypothetical protein
VWPYNRGVKDSMRKGLTYSMLSVAVLVGVWAPLALSSAPVAAGRGDACDAPASWARSDPVRLPRTRRRFHNFVSSPLGTGLQFNFAKKTSNTFRGDSPPRVDIDASPSYRY